MAVHNAAIVPICGEGGQVYNVWDSTGRGSSLKTSGPDSALWNLLNLSFVESLSLYKLLCQVGYQYEIYLFGYLVATHLY